MSIKYIMLLLVSSIIILSCSSYKLAPAPPKHQILFDMDLESGSMYVTANYVKDGAMGSSFLLNKDFVVHKILCDGKEIDIAESMKKVKVFREEVNQYNFPPYQNSLRIEYTGVLTGESGSFSHVRETISPEFTFLRFETLYCPYFASEESFMENLWKPLSFETEITVNVPKGYTAVLSLLNATQKETPSGLSFTATSDLIVPFTLIAIAEYTRLDLKYSTFYLLKDTDINIVSALADSIISHTDSFMSKHFGQVESAHKLRVVQIPNDLGAIAVPPTNIFFTENVDLTQLEGKEYLIHEYIHTKWNPLNFDSSLVQQTHFFTEAFTNYFTYRVIYDMLGEDVAQSFIERFKHTYGITDLPPIIDWGKLNYGGLSYTIGALCLYKLSELIGIETFDKVMTSFLHEHREKPVNFELFCKWFEDQSGHPEVNNFFQKWIYTNEYMKELK